MRRRPALAMLVFLVAAVVAAAAWIPWQVLPGSSPSVDVLGDFSPAQVAREQAFHRALRPWSFTSLAGSVAVAALLGLTPVGSRLVARLPRRSWLRVPLAVLLVVVIGQLVTLPLDARVEIVLRRYGLSTQTWAGWTDDLLRSLAIRVLTTSLVLLALLVLIRRAPRTWWAWGAVAAVAFVAAGSFVYPVLVEPAFNSFTSLPAGSLRTQLLALAARDHVPVADVLVADASRRTTALNAYVSGFGSTRRIVVYDTLLAQSPPQEVVLVVAHELGHAKRQDVLHGTAIGALGAGAGICALFLVLGSRPLLRRADVPSPSDARVIPLVLFVATAVPLLLSPVTNLMSRHIEARADVHALDLTRDVPTFVASERRLSVANLSDLEPDPVIYALFFTHPSGPQRIALARQWERLHR